MKTKIHSSITLDRVLPLAEEQMCGLSNPGICLACGEERDGCEPDAREYTCDNCNESQVYGAEEILGMISTVEFK